MFFLYTIYTLIHHKIQMKSTQWNYGGGVVPMISHFPHAFQTTSRSVDAVLLLLEKRNTTTIHTNPYRPTTVTPPTLLNGIFFLKISSRDHVHLRHYPLHSQQSMMLYSYHHWKNRLWQDFVPQKTNCLFRYQKLPCSLLAPSWRLRRTGR